MNRDTKLIIVHIILILIIFGMIVKIKLQEDNYNCKDCQAKFTNRIGYNKEDMIEQMLYENLTRMYEYYIKEDCSVRWVESGFSGALMNITI